MVILSTTASSLGVAAPLSSPSRSRVPVQRFLCRAPGRMYQPEIRTVLAVQVHQLDASLGETDGMILEGVSRFNTRKPVYKNRRI